MSDTGSFSKGSTGAFTLPRIRVADGTLEALKWFGLLLMTLDHVNKYIFKDAYPALFDLGRLAFPIFGFVLAYNLARPGALENGVYPRVISRLLIAGAIATPFFIALGGLLWVWWPLNILFTLAVATGCMWLSEKGTWAGSAGAAILFLVGGSSVEFWWPALAFILAAWSYAKRPNATALVIWILATASLYVINRNHWALAVLPLIYFSPKIQVWAPRLRNVFYVYYPAHLAVILAIATLLPRAH